MTMAFVQITNGQVTGVFANPSPGTPGYTVVPDTDPRIAAFLNPAPPTSWTVPGNVLHARLVAAGLWAAAVAALASQPQSWTYALTLTGSVQSDDPQAATWLAAAGASPSQITTVLAQP
jgi:hypothetical protein